MLTLAPAGRNILDRDQFGSVHHLTVLAVDGEDPPQTGTATVTVSHFSLELKLFLESTSYFVKFHPKRVSYSELFSANCPLELQKKKAWKLHSAALLTKEVSKCREQKAPTNDICVGR